MSGIIVTVSGENNISATINTKQTVLTTLPATWDEHVAAYGRGYAFPQPSGQTTIYRTGDNASIEASKFGASVRAAESLKAINSLSSFLVLNNTNSFGNTNRVTDELGTQVFANKLRIDHITGLMWYGVTQPLSTWDTAIDDALASTQGGYSDWFLPSLSQIFSAFNYYNIIGLSDITGFSSSAALGLSDTHHGNSLTYWQISSYNNIRTFGITKTTARNYIICRKHF